LTALTGQTVLVTGANRGMGRVYITQLLDERGVAKVYATARNPEIDVTDARVVPLRLDVTEAASVAAVSEAASDVGVLINNAGIVRGADRTMSSDMDPAATR
jgi:NAD(P)-dependent dehydrogenase (short-subunit alcohol dehydrogenase family)